jgi:GWxTD domain-containing protein
MRIRGLFGEKKLGTVPRTLVTLFVMGAVGIIINQTASAQSDRTNQNALDATKRVHVLPRGYQQWLDVDVRWIITPEERAPYLSLKNNDERDQFIKRFWARRNPPGTPSNTFRQEHYRRIAYTNEHFAATLPGWETDRGRIYIVYGPPDEIDNETVKVNGSLRSEQVETWHYRLIHENAPPTLEQVTDGYQATTVVRRNVDMKFVDVCSCGDYRLQNPSKD